MKNKAERLYERVLALAHDDLAQALVQANEFVDGFSNEALAWHSRSYVHMRMKLFDEALHDVNQAIKIEPKGPWGYNKAGDIQIKAKKYASAIDYLNVIIDDDSLQYRERFINEALLLRGYCYIKLKNFHNALVDFHLTDFSGTVWIDALYTKEELIALCQKSLEE